VDCTRPLEVRLTIVAPPAAESTPWRSHPDSYAIPHRDLARDAMISCRESLNIPALQLKSTSFIARDKADLPDYLAVWQNGGVSPAIWRTADPHFIIPALRGDETRLGTFSHWRTSTDLPVSGWEYWWEDAHRAWDQMVSQFTASQYSGGP
jgi:hypothetical protein